MPANPTFTKDILPIFEKSCQACHRPGQMAPFSLLTYDDARPWVRSIKNKVETRYMPPWHLDRTVGEYSPDPSLTDFEIATISKWFDNGAPRGDMNDANKLLGYPFFFAGPRTARGSSGSSRISSSKARRSTCRLSHPTCIQNRKCRLA